MTLGFSSALGGLEAFQAGPRPHGVYTLHPSEGWEQAQIREVSLQGLWLMALTALHLYPLYGGLCSVVLRKGDLG